MNIGQRKTAEKANHCVAQLARILPKTIYKRLIIFY